MTADGFHAATYGHSFADVYDEWYPSDALTTDAVSLVADLAGPDGCVLELGVGTGRLAVPLAAAGLTVTGLDPSPAMLQRLRSAAKAAGVSVTEVLGDAGDALAWPEAPVDVVLAACNLLFNLEDHAAQQRCFSTAAARLRDGGVLVVEAFDPAPLERRERRLEVKEVTAERVVLIATDADAATGVVVGQHIELVDGAPVRLRPWRICTASTDMLDSMAAHAGLVVDRRMATWRGGPPSDDSAGHVTLYRHGST